MNELRKGFHEDLDAARAELVRLAASVTEAIPRATAVLLDGDLEGADYIIQATTRSTPAPSTWKSTATGSWRCRLRLPATCVRWLPCSR